MKECPICWYHYDSTKRDHCPTCGARVSTMVEKCIYDIGTKLNIASAIGARTTEDYPIRCYQLRTGTVE